MQKKAEMDNNSSTSSNEKAEAKGDPSRSEEEALLKGIGV